MNQSWKYCAWFMLLAYCYYTDLGMIKWSCTTLPPPPNTLIHHPDGICDIRGLPLFHRDVSSATLAASQTATARQTDHGYIWSSLEPGRRYEFTMAVVDSKGTEYQKSPLVILTLHYDQCKSMNPTPPSPCMEVSIPELKYISRK